jgi:CRISPR-associated protein Cas2
VRSGTHLRKEVRNVVVMIFEKVPPGLRGELSRWMIEPSTGVFVGRVSALVRDKLWDKCQERLRDGGVIQVYSMNNEQGFQVRSAGITSRQLIDFEGLMLVKLENPT